MLAKTHTEVVPATISVATASSADTRGDGLIGVGGRIGGVLGAAMTIRGVPDAGGHDSPHMKDLQSSINAHVKPKLRKCGGKPTR